MTRDYKYLRERMVRSIERQGVRDQRVLAAMADVPRHLFVPEHLISQAYRDAALPIGSSQTISQPWVVARMIELLQVEPENSVLEIGTGSGYQTALLARLARWVFSLERLPELTRQAIRRMQELGVGNVKIQAFDGTLGWSDMAPFDRILVAAGAPCAPPPLLEQLVSGGRLLVPEGDRQTQRLAVYVKQAQGTRRLAGDAVAFVPLIGRHGWDED